MARWKSCAVSSFDVPAGQCFGLLGPNGAGKTTTLRCCLGLTHPDSGTIRLADLPIPARAREARVRVGVVPQFDNLDPDFTVTENLIVFGAYFGMSRRECESRVHALLDFAGLADKAQARIEALSGGMKRRLTLARAHDQRSADPVHGRADHGARSAGAPSRMGSPENAAQRGTHDRADDAFHG